MVWEAARWDDLSPLWGATRADRSPGVQPLSRGRTDEGADAQARTLGGRGLRELRQEGTAARPDVAKFLSKMPSGSSAPMSGTGMKTRFPRVDANHKAIVKVLREHPDVTVQSLAGVGDGTPDLLVGIAGLTHLVEVKDGDKSPSGRSLKPSQVEWVEHWNGTPVVVLFDVNQARGLARPRPGRYRRYHATREASGSPPDGRRGALTMAFAHWVKPQHTPRLFEGTRPRRGR